MNFHVRNKLPAVQHCPCTKGVNLINQKEIWQAVELTEITIATWEDDGGKINSVTAMREEYKIRK